MAKSSALTRQRAAGATPSYLTPTGAQAVRNLEVATGGRQALVDALQSAPASEDLDYVIGLISDPANDARDIAELCAAGRITVGELMEAYKRGVMASAQIRAIHHVAAHLPVVAQDVMTRAQVHRVVCPTCKGALVVENLRAETDATLPPVVPCKGCLDDQRVPQGWILVDPDLDRQKMALEMGGLGPKRAPVVDLSDRRKVSFGDNSAAGLANLIGAVDNLLHGRKRPGPPLAVPEAEVVEAEPLGHTSAPIESTIARATSILDADPDTSVAEPTPDYPDDDVPS